MSSRYVFIAAFIATALAIVFAFVVISTQPKAHAQKHNAYWPYSVEVSIKDR